MTDTIAKTSLKHRGNLLSDPVEQLAILEGTNGDAAFADVLVKHGSYPLCPTAVQILQVNLGKLCNMTCAHCHVDAGPDRREIMDRKTVDQCLQVLVDHPSIETLDLTGGAPEMNPHFCDFVSSAKAMNRHVIDRCNLTILLAKGFEYLPAFLAENQVEIVASLPCYLEENTDSQRGSGAFQKSIAALQKLNQLGYGNGSSGLVLTLVYNPVGPSLPPNQKTLEASYREQLSKNFGIEFDRLFTITNMPVSRYLEHLVQLGQFERYMQKLIESFNPASIEGLMCRNTLSVGWDGSLYDCDFNQMLELKISDKSNAHIGNVDFNALKSRSIVVGQHCFGCTAGAGSGCQGAIT